MKELFIPTFKSLNKDIYPRALPPELVQEAKNVLFKNRKVISREGYDEKGTNLPLNGVVTKLDEYERIRSNERTPIALTKNSVYKYDSNKNQWDEITAAYNEGTVSLPYSTSSNVFHNSAVTDTACCDVDDNKIVVAYYEDGVGLKLRAATIDDDGTPTWGATCLHTTNHAVNINVEKIDTDRFALTFIDSDDGNKGKYVTGDLVGVAVGTSVNYNFPAAHASHSLSMKTATCLTSPNTNKISVIYKNNSDSDLYAATATINVLGAPSWGSSVLVKNTLTDNWCICKTITDEVALGWRETNNLGYARISTITGTSMSLHPIGTAWAMNDGLDVISYTTNRIIFVFRFGTNIQLKAAGISTFGSRTLGFGATVNLYASSSNINTIISPDDGHIAAAFYDTTSSNQGAVKCARISGTAITVGNDEKPFNLGNKCNTPSIASILRGKIVVAFEDDDDSDKGKIQFMDWARYIGITTSWNASWPNNVFQIKIGTDVIDGTGTPEDIWYTVEDFLSTTALRVNPMNINLISSSIYILKVIFSGTDDDYSDSTNMLEGLTTGDENWLILANGVDPVMRYDGDTLQPLLSNPSIAKYCIAYHGHLLLGYCTDVSGNILPQSVYWSGRGDPTDWTSDNSSYIDLIQGTDYITGFQILNGRLYVFKQRSITEAYFTTLIDPAFDFKENHIDNIGTINGRTVVNYGEFIIMYGNNDFYIFNGFSVEPIGKPIIDDFLESKRENYDHKMHAIGVPNEFLYIIFIVTGSNTFPDICYAYNYRENSWTNLDYYNTITASKLLRSNEVILGDNNGNVYYTASWIDDDNGEDIDAHIVTGDLSLNDPNKAFRLLQTILTARDESSGSISIAPSFNFGTSYETAITMDLAVTDEVEEHVQRWLYRGDRVRFKIANINGSKFAFENLLIGFEDAGISLTR